MKFITIAFLVTFTGYVQAQKALCTIESKNGFTQIQGQPLGDSLFLTYYLGLKNAQNFQCMLVTPEGNVSNLILPELHKSTLLATTQTADSLCVYYFDKENKSGIPDALIISRTTGKKTITPLDFEVNGQITAFFVDINLFIVSVNKDKGLLIFTEIKNGRVINRQQFALPDDVKDLLRFKTKIIRYSGLVHPVDAVGQVKIYPLNGFYYVTIEYQENTIPTHVILNLNRATGAVNRWKFSHGKSRIDFSSHIIGNQFLRITQGRDFQVIRYDIEKQQAIDSFLIARNSAFAKQTGVQRNDRTDRISHDFRIKKIIKGAGPVFVTGYQTNSGIVVKMGTHQISTTYIPMVAGLGLAVQAITAMVSVAVAMNSADDLDQYFYVTWDGKSYEYIKTPKIAEKAMDLFESRPDVMFKGHLDGTTTTYGIYRFTSDKLWIVSFKR